MNEQLFYTIENVKKELPLVANMGGDGGAASNAGTAIQEYPISTPTQNQAVSTNVSWKLVKWQRLTGTHVGFNLLSSHSCDMCVPSRHIQLERSSRCGSSWSSHLDPIQICEHEHFIHEIRKQSQDVKEIILVQKSIPKKVLPQSNLVFILKSRNNCSSLIWMEAWPLIPWAGERNTCDDVSGGNYKWSLVQTTPLPFPERMRRWSGQLRHLQFVLDRTTRCRRGSSLV